MKWIQRIRRATAGLEHSEFAVLYRTNTQSLPLQIEFILNDVPYFVREEDNVLSNELLERLLGVLRTKLALNAGKTPTARDAVLTVLAYFRYR